MIKPIIVIKMPKMIVQKGGQVIKPIIVVKMPCKLLYVIQVKGFLIKCSTGILHGLT